MTEAALETGASPSAAIRARLDHPVVDADGHCIEFGPVFYDFLKQVAGPKVAERYAAKRATTGWYALSPEERRRRRVARPSAWTHPAKNTLDRATAMLPRLFRARLDEFGLDFSIVYGSIALAMIIEPDEELRRATCRAHNVMFADMFGDQKDRLAAVACIPTHTPAEAIAELEHSVKTLGLKAALVNSSVRRPIPAAQSAPEAGAYATWLDTLCVDSPYDYDPLWAKCVELKVAVTAHTPNVGYGSRVTTNHYIYNHVGSFAAAGEGFAKALVLGGVTRRFPTLNFAFLEGGVAWAAELYAGLVGHCSKRHGAAIGHYDPRAIDRERLADLFETWGKGMVAARPDPKDPGWTRSMNDDAGKWSQDDLIAHELDNLGIASGEDIRRLFEPHFYFGCEADDPLVAVAFDRRLNPYGARLKATFSSDVGHWDVPDMREVLAEAHELLERGLIDQRDFRDFVFVNPALLHAGMNPEFFKGTAIEAEVAKVLGSQRQGP